MPDTPTTTTRPALRGGLDVRAWSDVLAAGVRKPPARRRRAKPRGDPDVLTFTRLRGTLPPMAPVGTCGCRRCGGEYLWPAYYVGGRGICWECFLEGEHAAAGGADGPDLVTTSRDARNAGLTPLRPGRVNADTLTTGCEQCDGLRRPGRRYCLSCENANRIELDRQFWSAVEVEGWCAGEDWPVEYADVAAAVEAEAVTAAHVRELESIASGGRRGRR